MPIKHHVLSDYKKKSSLEQWIVTTRKSYASEWQASLPRMLCKVNFGISHWQTEWDFLRTSVTACTINKNTFSVPDSLM